MPPSLATYQKAAKDIYEPEKAVEKTALKTINKTTKNTLEAGKGQINTDYQSAVDALTNQMQDETAQISHLYTENLSGNFSGLQGNDMGGMFSRANQQRATIESTRANKLAQITTGEMNADIEMNAGIASLAPKYKSLETDYAQKGYGGAVKDYQDQQYKQEQLQLSRARLAISANNAANSAADKNAAKYKVTGKIGADGVTKDFSNGYNFSGPGGKPVNMAEYIVNTGGNVNDILDLLQHGSSYDQAIYRQAKASNTKNPRTLLSVIAAEDLKNYYGLR